MDLYMIKEGDVAVSASGDLAMTDTPWRDDLQQAYIRCMTDIGDFLIYPGLGANLSDLFGMPQSPDTGEHGKKLIASSLDREGRFVGRPFKVDAVPTGYQTIRFDVSIISGSREQIRLSVEQNLGVE